jgi:acyl dehydratase
LTIIVDGFDRLKARIGQHLGYSDWLEATQDRINMFADATSDHQWIHVDVERAKSGPFGGPIAHGYLTLSLVIPLWTEVLEVRCCASRWRATALRAALDPGDHCGPLGPGTAAGPGLPPALRGAQTPAVADVRENPNPAGNR